MKKSKTKSKLRSAIKWLGWALLVQFILLNISAASYAYKLTHLRQQDSATPVQALPKNIFAKTWRLFMGPIFYKQALKNTPAFAFSTISLKTKNGIAIESWYCKTDSNVKGTVILFHGLTGNKGLLLPEAAAFRALGYNVMLPDMRNHGNSGGTKTTIGYAESEEIKLAYDYILQQGEQNIFLWGSSLGAVELIKAVSDYELKPSGIIIEMPFLSLQSHLQWRARSLNFPEEPFGFLVSFWVGAENGFNGWGVKTEKYAANVYCPVLLQYGQRDGLVKEYETQAIFKALSSADKKLVIYENAGHESLVAHDPATWMKEVEAFLE